MGYIFCFDEVLRISRLNAPDFDETMTRLEDLKGRTRSKEWPGRPAKYPPMTKSISLWKIISNFWGMMLGKTCLDLIPAGLYIENPGNGYWFSNQR